MEWDPFLTNFQLKKKKKKKKKKKSTECDFQLKLAATATADRNPPARTVSAARSHVQSCDPCSDLSGEPDSLVFFFVREDREVTMDDYWMRLCAEHEPVD